MDNITSMGMKNAAMQNSGDFRDPDDLYQDLIARVRKYHPSADISMLQKAYEVAKTQHQNQLRKSGEPYIVHPLSVAIILANLELDKETIVAGILHDVVEDTDYTNEMVEKEFGPDVAQLVDGVSKLGKLNYSADKVEVQAENLRKMFLAMAKDIRVILIKLADRLHNMRTLQYMSKEKQLEKARETIDIYSPIAMRLGISKIKSELDDLSLKYLKPEVYYDLVEKINLKKSERQAFVDDVKKEIDERLKAEGIKARIDGRAKHFFSIYKKMVNQDKTISQIYDLFAVRIIVETVQDCYGVLGIIHEIYKPVPGRFKDYIAMPKPNRYQSLHTTVIGQGGIPFEIQIRTEEMHKTAEFGIAAHWKYKEEADGKKTSADKEEAKLAWLRQILDWQKEMSDNHEFMSILKSDLDLFAENVYCFTPEGDIKTLPNGSNTIDFAYSIHSAVGNRMIGARVNGKLVPIEHILNNGDRVEIITSQNSRGPSHDWLKIVKSTQARNKINQWFRKENKEENIVRGKDFINSYAKEKNITLSEYMKPEYQDEVVRKYGFKDWDSVLAAVGHGGLKEGQVVNKLIHAYERSKQKKISDTEVIEAIRKSPSKLPVGTTGSHSGIVVRGISDVSVRYSKCCNPIPGDEIVGFITRGRGISIHRTDCINVLNMSEEDRERIIEAEWESEDDDKARRTYPVEIYVYANNRKGIIIDISKVFVERELEITALNARVSKQGVMTIEIKFSMHNKAELGNVVDKIRKVPGVLDVERKSG